MTQGGSWRFSLACALLLGAIVTMVGCTTEEAAEAQRHQALTEAGEEAPADLFHTEVTLYRRYTGDWRLDKDHEFTIKDESHIKAEVELHQLQLDRTYSVHLVWIKPGGGEMFRRYAEVTRREVTLPAGVAPDSTGALPERFLADLKRRYGKKRGAQIGKKLAADPDQPVAVTETIYKKAVDLGHASTRFSLRSAPTVSLYSRLNISREKEREQGGYLLRIYLDRQLLQEVPFTVQERT